MKIPNQLVPTVMPPLRLLILSLATIAAMPLLNAKGILQASELSIEETGIKIRVLNKPENGVLDIARFNNPIKNAVLRTGDEEVDLQLKPQPTHWTIELPSGVALKGTEVFVETIGKPCLAGKPVIVDPDHEGVLQLHAHLAAPMGEMLRYEPQPHKNTIGFWVNENDYPLWTFKPKKTGTYRVEVLQGCGKNQGGSLVAFQTGDETIQYKVKETGHFQNFERHEVGTLKLDSTEAQTLQVRVINKTNKAVMDIRLIELIPAN